MGTYYTTNNEKQRVGPVTLIGEPTNSEELNSDPVDGDDFFKPSSNSGQLANAEDISVETSAFDQNFTGTDDNLQEILDKLDDLNLTAKTTEEIQDIVASLISDGSGLTKVYDDNGNILTISLSDQIFTSTLKTKLESLNIYYESSDYEYSSTYNYFLIDKAGSWTINRYDKNGVKTIANEINNSGTIDGATAWTNRLALTYS